MKILHFVDADSISFLVPWLDLLEYQGSLGLEQAILCRPGGSIEETARERGFNVLTWKPTVAALPFVNPGYRALVRSFSPDIVHTRLSSAARVAGYWGKSLKIPTIATFDKHGKTKYYINSDHCIACAKWLKDYMSTVERIPRDRIDVVYNSIETEKYSHNESERRRFRAEHRIEDNAFMFCGLGKYIPRKGFDVLLKAFSQVCRTCGRKLYLALIGDGEERRNYHRIIADSGIPADRVLMPEAFLQDVRPWLWGSDCFVMSSHAEGFSIALLEVLASGLPVIVSDIPPCVEIIEDGVNGLVAKAGDAGSFARALGRMLEMGDEEREKLAGKSFSMVENFTQESIANQTLQIYEKVLRQRS